MGRSLFPVLVFGIVLIAALAAILAINYSLNPYSAATQENVLGRTSFIGPPPEDLSAIFAPADDPFTAHAEYVQVSYSYTSDNKTVLEFIVKDEPGVKQYIYNEGYYSINNAWVKFTFPNATASGTKWIRGNASVRTAPLDVTTFTNHFAIVYVCRKYSDSQQFICGPKGASKNPNVRNWTVVQFYTWPPQAPPTIVYVCANTPGAFCAQTNTTPDANRTLWQSPFGMIAGGNTQFLQCPSGQSCFKCIDGFVNQSNGQCVGTCELMTGQFCATSSNGTPNSTGTCSPGKSCYSCPSGTQRQGDNCVQVTQCTPTCTTENARQCAASTPQLCSDTDAGTGVCLKWVDQTACTSTQTCSSGNCLSNCAATTGQFCATNPLAANIASGYCSSGSCYSCPSGMTFNAQANACQAPPPTCTQTNGGVEICDNIDNNCNNQVDDNIANVCGIAGPSIAVKQCVAGSWVVLQTCPNGCSGNVCAGACSPTKTCADYAGQCGTGFFDGCSNSLSCTCSSGSCSVSTGQGTCPTSSAQNIKIVSMTRSTFFDPVFSRTENTIYTIACRELDTPIGANLRVRESSASSGQELGVSTSSSTPLPLCNDPQLQSKGFHFFYMYAFGSDSATGTRSVTAELISISPGSDSIASDNTKTQTMVIG